MTDEHSSSVISRSRLEMLVDGVFAIAITILVLELKVPELEDRLSAAELARALLRQSPTFLSYLLSFFVLGMFWYAHNRQYRYYRTITAGMLATHFVQLAAAAFFPFCAGLMGRYAGNRVTVVVYVGCVLVYSWASAAGWLIAKRTGSLSDDPSDEVLQRAGRRALRPALILSAMFVLVLVQLAMPRDESAPTRSSDDAAIRALAAKWQRALLDRDAAGQAAMFAADGVEYHDSQDPLVGPAAVLAWEQKAASNHPKAKITTTTDQILIAASGDLAVQSGEGRITGLGANGEDTSVRRQRFVTVWKKIGGEWKVAHDMAVNITPFQ